MEREIKKIHENIRTELKLNDIHKPLFVASILIALCNSTFREIITNNNSFKELKNKEVLGMALNILKKHKFVSFSFLKNSLDNEKYFKFCKIINSNIKKYENIDILNEFYTEFVCYNNTDAKSLGIVLTPHHIITIMIKLLNIKETDRFIDFCCGTGSFLCEALKYNPKSITGVEYQKNLLELSECNMILRNSKRYSLIHDNCFRFDGTFDKIAINPPYGDKENTEQKFILKQIELLKDDGECCAIVPINCVNDNKKNIEFKTKILELCDILTIIKCNKKLFYPSANVEVLIIHMKKKKYNTQTLFINYEDDGFCIKRQIGKIKDCCFIEKYNNISNILEDRNISHLSYYKTLTEFDDWRYIPTHTILNLSLTEYKKYLLDKEYVEKLHNIETHTQHTIIYDGEELLKVNLKDLLKPIIKPDINYNGIVDIVSAKKYNYGVKEQVLYAGRVFPRGSLTIATA